MTETENAAKANEAPRACTCNPSDVYFPCQKHHAFWICENSFLKGRVRELEEGLAGMLDNFVGYCCPEVDAAISVMQKVGVDRWSMQAQMESVFAIPD